jgi:hydroxymethylbilane synthase
MAEKDRLVIGTRGSALALWQTNWVADALRNAYPNVEIEIKTIVTKGDATQASNVPLSSFGEKGIFAKELEAALLAGEIDLAVHSMKDLAHTLPGGLIIGAVPAREQPGDALIGSTFEALPQGARVGTGSVRRRALLAERRPDLQFFECRGNVDTRLRKLDEGQYDAIVLAVAGLRRLGLESRITEVLDPSWFIPDPGQGALAIEVRENDVRVREIIGTLNDPMADATTRAERAFLAAVGGSCQMPIGAHALVGPVSPGTKLELRLRVMLAEEGSIRRAEVTGTLDHPEGLGKRAAEELRA